MSNTTPPGWFPDPHVPGQQRYWNGAAWTEHTAPLHLPGPAPTAGPRLLTASATAPSPGAGPRKNWFLRHPVVSSVVGGVAALFLIAGVVGAAASGGDSDTKGRDTAASGADSVSSSAPPAVETTESAAPEPAAAPVPVDTDGDGPADEDDFLPADPTVQTADDVDTDGDGVPDPSDDFPQDPAFAKDTDHDGVADRLDAFPKDDRYSKDSDGDHVADAVDAFPSDPSRSKITLAMQNALDEAESYLDYSAFSRLGLIDQLSSDYGSGFELEDATWAVDQLGEDWKAQAVRSAKEYLDYTAFSRQGLIEQLSSSYGSRFTVEEATYAADKVGL